MTTADRMAVLDHGVLQQVGTPMQLYDEPVNALVAGFVGTMNQLPVQVLSADGSGTRVELLLASDGAGAPAVGLAGDPYEPPRWRLPAAAGQPTGPRAWLCCRPHTVTLRPEGAAAEDGRLWLQGSIVASEFLGEATRCRVRCGEAELWADVAHRAGDARPVEAAAVQLGIDPQQVRLLAG